MRQVSFNVASNGRKDMQRIWSPHVSKFIGLVEQHENPLAFLVQAVLVANSQKPKE